ncbi:hypothetical protein D6C99_01003 [Aureobasidium pullulans]|nr:hypothetical protein D6C99_01003 [Aureobasidium pullulans]
MKIFTILSIVVAMASAATIPTNTPDISTSDLSTSTSASSSASNFASEENTISPLALLAGAFLISAASFPVQDPDDDGTEWVSFSYLSSSSASSASLFSSSGSSITSDPKKSSDVKVTRTSKFTTKIAGWFRRI